MKTKYNNLIPAKSSFDKNILFFYRIGEKNLFTSVIKLFKETIHTEKHVDLVHVGGTQKQFKKLQHAIEWQKKWLKIKFSNPYK